MRLTVRQRRFARQMAYANGTLWSFGNGLISSTLVIYLALELGAKGIGLGISLIVAAPRLAGMLRLAAPALIGRLGDRKQFTIFGYAASAVVLFGIPWVAAPGILPSAGASLMALVGLWCVYHLLEYLAGVALWSWMADLVRTPLRGRFLGIRQRWMIGAQAFAMLDAGLFSYTWRETHLKPDWWIGYAIPATIGGLFMIGAIVPLWKMPRASVGRVVSLGETFRTSVAPFVDGHFLRLLMFGCWFSFFNGVTQAPQHVYPAQILGFGLFVMLGLKVSMRLGQLAISPQMGRLTDLWGNRPVMFLTLPLVASGPLFYFIASKESPWWLIGAWIVWIAYAGLNIALPNLMLKLSPEKSSNSYIAAYFAITGFCYGISTVLGGWLYDYYGNHPIEFFGDDPRVAYCRASFLFGWLTRTAGLVWLLGIVENRPVATLKHRN